MGSSQMNQTAKSIRKLVIGIIISEYALMELREGSKQDLKFRCNAAISACKRVQDYFLHHPQASDEIRQVFKKEFVKSEIFMISELMETVWGFDDNSIEEIIEAIKKHTEESKEESV